MRTLELFMMFAFLAAVSLILWKLYSIAKRFWRLNENRINRLLARLHLDTSTDTARIKRG